MVENSNQKWNKYLRCCEFKNTMRHCVCEKNYSQNPILCACKIVRYLKNIISDSVVVCDEIIDVVVKSYDKPTNLNEKKKQHIKQKISIFYLPFY